MTNECLLIGGTSFCNVDEIVENTVLQSKEEIEVSKPRIRIDESDLFSMHRQTDTEICRRRRLSDAALAGRNNNDSAHKYDSAFPIKYLQRTICDIILKRWLRPRAYRMKRSAYQ